VTLRLDWCSHAAAKYAVEHWHYSRTMPASISKPVKIGVWEDGSFIGAAIFTTGSSSKLVSPYGIANRQGCELQRVALTVHRSSVTRIVAVAMKMIHRAYPQLRLVVSFADPGEAHVGTIYQAGNWIYSGMSAPSQRYFDRMGIQRHSRNVKARAYCDKAGVVNYARSDMVRVEMLPGKHRYLYPLDAAMRAQIEPLRKPYPKRAVSTVASAPTVQVGEGGAEPTTALQTTEQVT